MAISRRKMANQMSRPPESREKIGLGKLVAYNDHGQRRIQLRQVGHRGENYLGQGYAGEVQSHGHHYTDDAGN